MVVNSGEKVALIKQSFKKDHKSSKQRRFFSLHETFLYYFKKEKDPLPAGAIPLEYYVIQKKLKKKKFNMTLELSVPLNEIFKTLTISYKLQADSIDQLNFWFDRIRKKVFSYSPFHPSINFDHPIYFVTFFDYFLYF